MKLAIGADHAGFELKAVIAQEIAALGHDVVDLGAHEYQPLDDYPDFSFAVARAVADHKVDRGVIVCGSGIGACVAANKVKGVRAAMAFETYTAHQGVEHDDVNVLVLGGRVTGVEVAREVLRAFLKATFTGEHRHVRRLNKILEIEASELAPHTPTQS